MKLRTELIFPKSTFSITHQTNMVIVGSCFSENIGKRFQANKFEILVNPFGQQYNPISIANGLKKIINSKKYTSEDLFFHQEQYHSFDFHSQFSQAEMAAILETLNNQIEDSYKAILEAKVLFVTFGTAHVFKHKSSGEIVSNCHKLPAKEFENYLVNAAEIETSFLAIFEKLFQLNKNLQVVFTVSPVRYFAKGFFENSVSKSILFQSIHNLISQFKNCFYFPSYELILDDLRDYRFYKEDLLHPNSLALDYVWEKISAHYFEENTLLLLKEIEEINAAFNHRPRNPESKDYKQFLENAVARNKDLENRLKGYN